MRTASTIIFTTINNAFKCDGEKQIFVCSSNEFEIIEYDENACNGDGYDCALECNENVNIYNQCFNIEETTSIDIQNQNMVDQIPSEVGELINLNYLLLSHNQLYGEIPSEIGNLINLTTLSLDNNNLSGIIPETICNQGDTTPNVRNNQFCPPYPSCISQSNIDSQDTSNCP